MQLSNEVKMTVVQTGAVAGTTEVDTSILDMAGYDGVMFVAVLGTVTAGSVLAISVQQNALNQTGGMAAIVDGPSGANAAAGLTDVGGASSNGALAVDVFRPLSRYVRAALTRTTANAVVQTILAFQYKAKKRPTLQDASVLALAQAIGS
jgi:hypothetical protein